MVKIDIDNEVFEFLQKKAKPFVDTPNIVLRRLFQIDNNSFTQKNEVESTMSAPGKKTSSIDTNEFVRIVLNKEFTEEFKRKSPYRYMFESNNSLIYFQNFNQESATLWYRVNEKSLKALKSSSKKCFLCLTNPAESIAYLIPLEDVEKQIASSNYKRDYLEINIDHISRKWKELDWNIKQFLKTY